MTRMWLYLIDALINKTRKPNFLKTDIFSFVFMKKIIQDDEAVEIRPANKQHFPGVHVSAVSVYNSDFVNSFLKFKKEKEKEKWWVRNIVHFHSLLLKILWSSIYFICACFISLSELHDSQYDRPQSSAASHDETITVHSWIWLWINC